ncbi:sulfur carrier protein ThiS [Chrysiogenes arsenatis]|uniref:sulfur carrier protein ThiS n=1 Tax=Chrysiogenes arsenatis TaxID=309797 RepID=UPI000415126B|nr:sulfur carrier protein ThiS [Chrysiogenes arsenatis]
MAQINGRPVELSDTLTVNQLKEKLGITATRLAVEVDGTLLYPENFEEARITNDSVVEVITLVGGG